MNPSATALIEPIYAAAGHGDKWNRVLKDLSGLTGASSGCIVSATDQPERGRVSCFHEIDPDWINAYNRWYYSYDPTLAVLANQPGRILVDHVTGRNPGQLRGAARVFYHEVMVPQSFRHTLQLGLSAPGGQSASLILQRSARQGAFSEAAVTGLNCLVPHLTRALSLNARLNQLDYFRRDLVAAMDQADRGLIFLDAKGGIVHMNHLAQTLLRQANALYLAPSGLSAYHPHDHQALQACIRQGLAPTLEHQHQRSAIRLSARDGSPALHLEVAPLRAQPDSFLGAPHQTVKALVWIDRYEQKRISAATLSALYHLTNAEAEVLARLAEGCSQSDIAKHRSVSRETVRCQIKSLMAKLGASRQAELIRIVLSDPGIVRNN